MSQNLDAYRIIAEILFKLRGVVHRRLEQRFGKDWYRKGVPPAVLDRLIETKEKEQAVDWYEPEYQEIMDYANFEDLLGIIEQVPDSFPGHDELAPSDALLHTRLLELDMMRTKIARARPISDNELGYLTNFHLRFRRALEVAESAPPATADAGSDEVPVEVVGDEAPAEPPPAAAAAEPARSPEAEPETVPIEVPAEAGAAAETESETEAEERPPSRRATPRPQAGAAAGASAAAKPMTTADLEKALVEGDDRTVLRELYREVTAIAEAIWSNGQVGPTRVWGAVSAHSWYGRKISTLGLKPLSDFYETVDKVEERIGAGIDTDELQRFLKECGFAKLLLSLRDMFQRSGI